MFIVREPKKNRLQPRRGGMGPLGACHAAPTGLKTVAGVRGGYKHVAPPELGPCGIREREVAGAKSVERMAAGDVCLRIRSPGVRRHRSPRRMTASLTPFSRPGDATRGRGQRHYRG
jgi:hypothetical protein